MLNSSKIFFFLFLEQLNNNLNLLCIVGLENVYCVLKYKVSKNKTISMSLFISLQSLICFDRLPLMNNSHATKHTYLFYCKK